MLGAVPTIDIGTLLQTIPGDNPCGQSLLYAGLHDDIRQARRSDVDIGTGEMKEPDWEKVISLAVEALESKTKDLQVAAWLGEALVKRYGFYGLNSSLNLISGMYTHFWENFYPEIEQGDMEARANSMSWYDRQVSACLKEVPITDAPNSDNFSFFRWQETSLPEEYQQIALNSAEEADSIKERCDKTAEEWARLFRATPRKFYEETAGVLKQCWDGYIELDHLMDEKFGQQTPGLGELRKALEEIRGLMDRLIKEKLELEPESEDKEGIVSDVEGNNRDGTVAMGAVRSRRDALNRLAEVAEYFQRTEPHSPVAYLVRRAIKWGNMPLEKWLQDIIKDSSVLDHVHETLGFKTNVNVEETAE